jgi:hypothetical protein
MSDAGSSLRHRSARGPIRRTILPMSKLLTVAALSLLAAVAGGHEGHHAKADQLTGEVIDLTCYLDHGSVGPKHAECARKCIERGLPVGLLVNGKVYNVIISSHEAPNAKLAPYAGQMVTITGKTIVKNGTRAIDMEDVKPVGQNGDAPK